MTLPRTVAAVISRHVTLEVESIDRMYLNVYQPRLQTAAGVAAFFRSHRGHVFASSALMDPISKAFIAQIETFTAANKVPLLGFTKGQRKDDVTKEYLAKWSDKEGVLYVGKAQEKAPVFRTEKRRNPATGPAYPWIVKSTAMVNQYYFYCVDDDFGPFFLKFCSYFPYNAKLCINGHEYVNRQLAKEEIAFEALDNGVLSCANPQRMQELCDGLSAEKIDALLRKWLARLPHPFSESDRKAGYRYDISILQAEFSLTQVLDRPPSGRIFFEEAIKENLDLGRPDQVQLIFDRRVTRRTPGRFRTRVLTEGVTPSLHIDYKRSRIKQYHKEGRALRTETTINDSRDFGIGKRRPNLAALRKVGFAANRRLLEVQRISQDCTIGEDAFRPVNEPVTVDGQRASGLRFADPVVQALFAAVLLFRLLPKGFTNREVRDNWASLMGQAPESISRGQMSYHLRRLRLHGVIERVRGSQRYRVTHDGWRTVYFCARIYDRVLRPGLSQALGRDTAEAATIRREFDRLDEAIDGLIDKAGIAA